MPFNERSMGGRKPTVSDAEILRCIADSDDPFLWTDEVAEQMDMTPQGMIKRLHALEDAGYLKSKSTGNALAWYVSQAGRNYLDSGAEGQE